MEVIQYGLHKLNIKSIEIPLYFKIACDIPDEAGFRCFGKFIAYSHRNMCVILISKHTVENSSRYELYNTIIHELTHYKQHIEGRLTSTTKNMSYEEYKNDPAEKEARRYGNWYAAKMLFISNIKTVIEPKVTYG